MTYFFFGFQFNWLFALNKIIPYIARSCPIMQTTNPLFHSNKEVILISDPHSQRQGGELGEKFPRGGEVRRESSFRPIFDLRTKHT